MSQLDFTTMETPALILDVDRLKTNAVRMLNKCERQGVLLRPHLKTPKSIEVAKIATGGRMKSVTVSTLAEAEYFANAGFDDILYAVGITPNKFGRVQKICTSTGKQLVLLLDSIEMAKAVKGSGLENPVLIEVDCGESRGGISPVDPALIEIAKILGDQFRGIMSHAGHSYSTDQISKVKEIAGSEIGAAVAAADKIRNSGMEVGVVSVGSTPTAFHAEDIRGITEFRAGIYLFQDLSQYGRNICALEDIAMSVLTTVIGHNRQAGLMTIDAGGLALSKDLGASKFLPGAKYGWLCGANTMEPTGLAVDLVHQEHGSVNVVDSALFDKHPIGSQLRVLPVHACMTAAGGYGRYHTTDGDIWLRQDGW